MYELLRYAPVVELVAELREDLGAAHVQPRAGEVAAELGGGVEEDERDGEWDGGGSQVRRLKERELGGGGVQADHEVRVGRIEGGGGRVLRVVVFGGWVRWGRFFFSSEIPSFLRSLLSLSPCLLVSHLL